MSNYKHGATVGGRLTSTYQSWSSMLTRCYNRKTKSYKNYGGRGIGVHSRWHNYANFLEDMGERPPGTSLDRHPNQKGNYEPGNCRWATDVMQSRNRSDRKRYTYDGQHLLLSEWSELTGIPMRLLVARVVEGGWTIERALTDRGRNNDKDIKFLGDTSTIPVSLRAWARNNGISKSFAQKLFSEGRLPVRLISRIGKGLRQKFLVVTDEEKMSLWRASHDGK